MPACRASPGGPSWTRLEGFGWPPPGPTIPGARLRIDLPHRRDELSTVRVMALPLPPEEIVRQEAAPPDLLLVVRGGRNSLNDANLERAVGDCWLTYGFFGLSVFGAPDDDLVALSNSVSQVRRRREVRVARCGHLRAVDSTSRRPSPTLLTSP